MRKQLLIVVLFLAVLASTPVLAQAKPNVIYIMSDDK
jgi:hypothetical protein